MQSNKHMLAKVKTASQTSPRRSPSPPAKVATRSPSPPAKVATRRNLTVPAKVATRSPSPPAKVVTRRNLTVPAKVATQKNLTVPAKVATRRRRNLSPKAQKDPYYTPFWPPSNYSVPAKIIVNDPNPLPRTLAKYKIFIEELRKILIIEKIIDRENSLFEKLLAVQQEWNHLFNNLKPYKIICFIKCDYYLHDKKAPRVFHHNNLPEPFFGNFKFLKLLGENNMGVKRLDNNILYIHENRF